MSPKILVSFGVVLVIIVAGIALRRQVEPVRTGSIYLLDARLDPNRPLEQSLPVIKQLERKYEAKVIVRTATSLNLLTNYRAMFKEFDRTQDAVPSLPMLFALDKPYASTEMSLRQAVDASLSGAVRASQLRRLVIVRDTKGLGEADGCEQLENSIFYANNNFLGIGLLIQDDTLDGLKKCVDVIAPAS